MAQKSYRKEDDLTERDKIHLPVKGYKDKLYDDELGNAHMTLYNVYDSSDELICQCPDMRTMRYVVNVMNDTFLHKKILETRKEIRDECITSFIIDGAIVPKEEKIYPYEDAEGIIRYRKSAEYRRFIGKAIKNEETEWVVRGNKKARNMNLYLVILFYVKSDFNIDIGECIATITDVIKESGLITPKKNNRLIGVAKAQLVVSNEERTEVFLMRHSYRSK